MHRSLIFALVIVAACSMHHGDPTTPPPPPPSELEIETGIAWNLDVEPTFGTLDFAEPRGPGPLVLTDGKTPTEAALEFLEAHTVVFALESPRNDLAPEADGRGGRAEHKDEERCTRNILLGEG